MSPVQELLYMFSSSLVFPPKKGPCSGDSAFWSFRNFGARVALHLWLTMYTQHLILAAGYSVCFPFAIWGQIFPRSSWWDAIQRIQLRCHQRDLHSQPQQRETDLTCGQLYQMAIVKNIWNSHQCKCQWEGAIEWCIDSELHVYINSRCHVSFTGRTAIKVKQNWHRVIAIIRDFHNVFKLKYLRDVECQF